MYEFASAVINVWEKKIFDKTDQERMLKAPDRESALMVLFDADIGEFVPKEEADEISILEKDYQRMKVNLSHVLGENARFLWFLFLKFDALNLKIALKKTFFKTETAEIGFFAYANEPYQEIERRVSRFFGEKQGLKKEPTTLFPPLNPLVEKMLDLSLEALRKIHLSEFNSTAIEKAVDEAYFKVRLQTALSISKMLGEMTRFEIDIANIKATLRNNGFLGGGNLSKEEIVAVLGLKKTDVHQEHKGLEYFLESLAVLTIARNFAKSKSEFSLDSDLQSFFSRKVFERARQTGFGLEKVMAFFQKKINSHNNIRLILFAKANNLSVEDIEKNLLPI